MLAGSTASRRPGRRGRPDARAGLRAGPLSEAVPPEVRGQAKVDELAKDGELRQLGQPFKFKNDWALNPDLPVVTPWKTVQPINTPIWTLERNPYNLGRHRGNQLPYIDKIQFTLAENLEVVNLRAIAGEYDFRRATSTSASCRSSWRTSRRATTRSTLDTG